MRGSAIFLFSPNVLQKGREKEEKTYFTILSVTFFSRKPRQTQVFITKAAFCLLSVWGISAIFCWFPPETLVREKQAIAPSRKFQEKPGLPQSRPLLNILKTWHHRSLHCTWESLIRAFVCSKLFAAAGTNSVKNHPENVSEWVKKKLNTSHNYIQYVSSRNRPNSSDGNFSNGVRRVPTMQSQRYSFHISSLLRSRVMTISNIEQIAVDGQKKFLLISSAFKWWYYPSSQRPNP